MQGGRLSDFSSDGFEGLSSIGAQFGGQSCLIWEAIEGGGTAIGASHQSCMYCLYQNSSYFFLALDRKNSSSSSILSILSLS